MATFIYRKISPQGGYHTMVKDWTIPENAEKQRYCDLLLYEAVVRYTLNKQRERIFASRYKMYLPTENELAQELKRERAQIEQEHKLREGK